MVKVSYDRIVALFVLAAESLCKVEVCVFRIEALPPCSAVLFQVFLRGIPMPAKWNYSVFIVVPIHSLQWHHISAACAMWKCAVWKVWNVKTKYGRRLACVLLYLLELTAVPALVISWKLTWDSILAINVCKEVIKSFCLVRSVRVRKLIWYLILWKVDSRSWGYLYPVDIDMTIVALYAYLMSTLVDKHVFSHSVAKFCCGRCEVRECRTVDSDKIRLTLAVCCHCEINIIASLCRKIYLELRHISWWAYRNEAVARKLAKKILIKHCRTSRKSSLLRLGFIAEILRNVILCCYVWKVDVAHILNDRGCCGGSFACWRTAWAAVSCAAAACRRTSDKHCHNGSNCSFHYFTHNVLLIINI